MKQFFIILAILITLVWAIYKIYEFNSMVRTGEIDIPTLNLGWGVL